MRAHEIISESLSRVAYHYTGLPAAQKIVQSGQFELSSVLGSIEQQYAPAGYPYFLSTTRTRTGGYHDYIHAGAVMFVLDGDWFNQRYPAKAVDYWENRDPKRDGGRRHEAEDRVFSRKPVISIGGVSAIHVYLKRDLESDSTLPASARQLMIGAKRQGIPVYLYHDEQAWRNMNTGKSAGVSDRLRGQEPGPRYPGSRAWLTPWLELIGAQNQNQLSKKANDIRYSLQYTFDQQESAKGLANDLSNARKPNSGPDREIAVKIIRFMQQNRIATVVDLVKYLADKWREKK